ncbi:hypothetical protein V8E36_009208 [Tilletia maclaganii]
MCHCFGLCSRPADSEPERTSEEIRRAHHPSDPLHFSPSSSSRSKGRINSGSSAADVAVGQHSLAVLGFVDEYWEWLESAAFSLAQSGRGESPGHGMSRTVFRLERGADTASHRAQCVVILATHPRQCQAAIGSTPVGRRYSFQGSRLPTHSLVVANVSIDITSVSDRFLNSYLNSPCRRRLFNPESLTVSTGTLVAQGFNSLSTTSSSCPGRTSTPCSSATTSRWRGSGPGTANSSRTVAAQALRITTSSIVFGHSVSLPPSLPSSGQHHRTSWTAWATCGFTAQA